ncbi:unnamed protein product [Lepeophtheirus salmonis]|uniref:SKA complex subunit 1 n=1 Tax=Lepeophtheirus salmonis TaxID=72036 RepID=A0A7R8CBI6_LEPSM|nr:unnamed protein product [Lepeophtheirus salmonis]CAF2760938.1 unnamed protein product [Lepeophtheirus salmonis]
MEEITNHLEGRLDTIEEGFKWMSSGVLEDTLACVDSTAFIAAKIEIKSEKFERLKFRHEDLVKESRTWSEKFHVLRNLQKELITLLPQAMIKSKDTLTSENKNKNLTIPSLIQFKLPEFDSIPAYMKGRLNYNSLNQALEEFNSVLKTKYTFFNQGFNPNANFKTKTKYQEMKKLETKETKGLCFLVMDDIKALPSFKTDSSRKSIFSILRHFHKIKEIRGPGSIVRYAVIEGI